jgi:hypothetical protein
MRIRGTDFVVDPVSDLGRTATFYRDVRGLAQEVCSEEWRWAEFNCGNTTLARHAGDARPEGGVGPGAGPAAQRDARVRPLVRAAASPECPTPAGS